MNSSAVSRKISLSRFEGNSDQGAQCYQVVRLGNLLPECPVPFNVYCSSGDAAPENGHRLFLAEGDLYGKASRDELLERQVDVVYVMDEDLELLSRYMAENLRKVPSDFVPLEERTPLLYNHAVFLVERVLSRQASVSDMDLAVKLVRTAASHFSADDVTARGLLSVFSPDYQTATHSVQVSFLAMAFATYLGWLKTEVADVGVGALFHDVGKNKVDDRVLNKRDKLTREESALVRKHSVLGYDQLKGSRALSMEQLDVVLHHHEDVSGGGYPDGLKGKEIHKYARIVRIVDCFDAMTTTRPYRDAVSKAEALRVMNEEMKGCLDVYFLDAFTAFCGMGAQHSASPGKGTRIAVEMESFVQLQFRGSDLRLKSKLVGIETGYYLIVRPPKSSIDLEWLKIGSRVIVRYMCAGTIYGFQSTILGHMEQPVQFLILSYPKEIEQHDLRRFKRVECLLPAKCAISLVDYPGMIVDISLGGCKFLSTIDEEDILLDGNLEEEVRLSFELPGTSGSQSTQGRIKSVRWDGAKLELGIQFFGVDQVLHDRLKNFMRSTLSIMCP